MRHNRKLATINSQKHIVQVGPQSIALGAILNSTVAVAVRAADADAPTEVRIGSVVKAVYVEMWLTGDAIDLDSSTIMTLEKLPLSTDSMAVGDAAALDTYFNKNNVFYSTQGLVGPINRAAVPFMRAWFKIPKGKQRMDEKSAIKLNISAVLDGLTVCGLYIFKEYY